MCLVLLAPMLVAGSIVQSNLTDNTSQSAFPCLADDLINGGTSVSNKVVTGSPIYGDPVAMTNGVIGAPSTQGTNCVGNEGGWDATFYLDTSGNTNGYTITNISTFAAWGGGRISQGYEVKFAFQGDASPGTFYSYGSFSLSAGAPADGSTKIELTGSSGAIASNVCAVRFIFVANGAIYREFDVQGVPSTTFAMGPPVVTVYVATNGSHASPFDTWEKAATNIASALGVAPNATIFVSNGTYYVTSELALNDGTVLRSMNGASNTTVRRAAGSTRIFNLAAGATVDGFTVRDGNIASGGGAINMTAGTIRNCVFIGNSGVYGAIHMTGGIVSNCTFTGNAATASVCSM